MRDTHETIYPGQEFFRIIHAGRRAGLYRVEILPTGTEAETRLGEPLRASVIQGNGGGLLLEWLDPDERQHSYIIPAEKMRGRLALPLTRMAAGGWRNHILTEERRRMFRRFLVAVWNAALAADMAEDDGGKKA